jgi:hypothetical protein
MSHYSQSEALKVIGTPPPNRVVSRFYKYPYSEQRLAPLELLEVRLRVRPEVRRQLVQ